MINRRRHERRELMVPVSISTRERRDRVGMIRDASISGILFHSQSRFTPGERVVIMFKLANRRGTTAGHVVRAETDDHPDNMFRFLTAVRFDAPLLDVEI